MSNTETKLNAMRKMNHVYRCAGTRLLRPYSLSEHGFQVMNLFHEGAKQEGIEITAEQLFCVANHDIVETQTGDLLYPVKNKSGETQEYWNGIEAIITRGTFFKDYTDHALAERLSITPGAYELFKACDMLELLLTMEEERACGNAHPDILAIIETARRVLKQSPFLFISRFLYGD